MKLSQTARAKVLCILFAAALLLGALAMLLVPDRSFSENENRYLASFPALSLKTVGSGQFMKEFETYVTDQFPARDSWVSLKAEATRLSGKLQNNGVYFGSEGTLLQRFETPDEERLEKNLSALSALIGRTKVPVSVLAVPSSTLVYASRLPAGAWSYDEQQVLDRIEKAAEGAVFVSGAEVLLPHSDEYVYYRTDHHWTTPGAAYAYDALRQAQGKAPIGLDAYERATVSSSFLGTLFSKNQLWNQKTDSIEHFDRGGSFTMTILDDGSVHDGLYAEEFLSKKDKYSYFLGGNHAQVTIVNNDPEKTGKLLILKDSFAHCFAPLIAEDYAQIQLIDLRYCNFLLSDFIEKEGFDEVLVLYSTDTFCTDANVIKLGK